MATSTAPVPDTPAHTVDAFHRAIEEAIAPAVAVAAIADFVEIGVQRSRRHFVQQRLPDMGAVPFDQEDVKGIAPEMRAQPRRQFQATGAAAHHHDLRFPSGRLLGHAARAWRLPL